MIIDSPVKGVPPPPPYTRTARDRTAPPPPFVITRHHPTLCDLPQHVLLQIVHSTCGPHLSESQHKAALYWLAISLRMVNRAWYIACMHVLRSYYLPLYVSHVRPPYSCNPFPLSAPTPLPSPASSSFPFDTQQRETAILDIFIAFKVRQDVLKDESELHLEAGNEGVRDLFELMQPRARTEDLLRRYLLKAGIITIGPQVTTPTRGYNRTAANAIPFVQLSVSFSTRKVGVVRATAGKKRVLVSVSRDKDEPLESVAKRLAKELVNSMDVIE